MKKKMGIRQVIPKLLRTPNPKCVIEMLLINLAQGRFRIMQTSTILLYYTILYYTILYYTIYYYTLLRIQWSRSYEVKINCFLTNFIH